MRYYILFSLILLFITFSCDSEKSINNKKSQSKTQFNQTINKYNPISICDCNDDGIKTLESILNIRTSYSTFELYQNDKKSINSVNLLKKEWALIRDSCIKKFAAKLFIPSDCNEPDKIGSLRDKLNKLNIKTS